MHPAVAMHAVNHRRGVGEGVGRGVLDDPRGTQRLRQVGGGAVHHEPVVGHDVARVELAVDGAGDLLGHRLRVAVQQVAAAVPVAARALPVGAGNRAQAAIRAPRRVQRQADGHQVGVGVREHRPVLMPADLGPAVRQLEVDLRVIELHRAADQGGGNAAEHLAEGKLDVDLVELGRAGDAADARRLPAVPRLQVVVPGPGREPASGLSQPLGRRDQALQRRRLDDVAQFEVAGFAVVRDVGGRRGRHTVSGAGCATIVSLPICSGATFIERT